MDGVWPEGFSESESSCSSFGDASDDQDDQDASALEKPGSVFRPRHPFGQPFRTIKKHTRRGGTLEITRAGAVGPVP